MKVLTPQQLKEHNKLLKQQLLLKEKEDQEELERQEQEAIDYKQGIDDGIATIPVLVEDIDNLKGVSKEVVQKVQDIGDQTTESLNSISSAVKEKANKTHTHNDVDIVGLSPRLSKIEQELNQVPNTISTALESKLDKGYKPTLGDIDGLGSNLAELSKRISDIKIPEIDLSPYCETSEVDKLLDNYWDKDHTYNRDEINARIHRNKGGAGYNYINDSITDDFFTWSSTKISEELASATPLTTKGDLFTFTTVDARLGVGTNGQILSANSSTATGLEWIASPDASVTLLDVSANSTTTPNSIYNLSAGIPVNFKSSDGNTILYLDETNERVGIGTAAPTTKLTVYESTTTNYNSASIPFDTTPGIVLANTESSDNSNYSGIQMIATGLSGGTAYSFIGTAKASSYGDMVFGTRAADGFLERMRILSAGFVGIGTTSPDRLLHAEVSDAETNAVTYAQRLTHISSGTVANNFGVGTEYELENASSTNRVAASQEFSWSDATDATEDATYTLKLMRAGTLTQALAIDSVGNITPVASANFGGNSNRLAGMYCNFFYGGGNSADYLFFTAGGYNHGFNTANTNAGVTSYSFTFQGASELFNSGTGGTVRINRAYAPTSGTGVFSSFEISPTINQTGGANGITRGIYINPTLTSAADYRAIDVVTGDSKFQKVIANAPVRLKGYTVATLPAGTQGDTAFVTDALLPTFLATIAGGGAVVTKVFYDGTNRVAG